VDHRRSGLAKIPGPLRNLKPDVPGRNTIRPKPCRFRISRNRTKTMTAGDPDGRVGDQPPESAGHSARRIGRRRQPGRKGFGKPGAAWTIPTGLPPLTRCHDGPRDGGRRLRTRTSPLGSISTWPSNRADILGCDLRWPAALCSAHLADTRRGAAGQFSGVLSHGG